MKHKELTKKDMQEFKSNFKISSTNQPIQAFVLVSHKNMDKNKEFHIPVSGTPINFKSSYDITRDAYSFMAVDFYDLGYIGTGYIINFVDSEVPPIPIPCPEEILMKFLPESSKAERDLWIKKYPKEDYDIKYLQVAYSIISDGFGLN